MIFNDYIMLTNNESPLYSYSIIKLQMNYFKLLQDLRISCLYQLRLQSFGLSCCTACQQHITVMEEHTASVSSGLNQRRLESFGLNMGSGQERSIRAMNEGREIEQKTRQQAKRTVPFTGQPQRKVGSREREKSALTGAPRK